MNNLDDRELYARLDPEGMFQRIVEFPNQCAEAQARLSSLQLPTHYAQAEAIVILGMGGSAIAGDLVQGLVENQCRVPFIVRRNYTLPAFVDADTLVIANSYSGNTEETLSAAQEALSRGAKLIASSRGGKLAQIAQERGLPWLEVTYQSAPRAALAHSLVPLLAILHRLGFIGDYADELAKAIEEVKTLQTGIHPEVPVAQNTAKALATRLYGRLPVIYGAEHLAAVARRWTGQCNENAKSWSFFAELPELNHNSVEGYQFPTPLAREALVVMLSSSLYHPRIQKRLRITGEILTQRRVEYVEVEAKGSSPLAQTLTSIHLGDYVSGYLALLYGVKPAPNTTIDYLKERLS